MNKNWKPTARIRFIITVLLVILVFGVIIVREYKGGATNLVSPTQQPTLTPPFQGYIAPYPSAPLCPDTGANHNNNLYHGLWDGVRGCHYDHEHGQNPFTQVVTDTFPGFDLQALLGGTQIGSTNPSSPAENVAKHGGFKWQVQTTVPHPCELGFESANVGISSAVIEYHNFGAYSIEFGARVHSAVALLAQCLPTNPSDLGYIYTVQFEDYGQRITPYQGVVLNYPDTPNPPYMSPSGPYFSVDCVLPGDARCRTSLDFILSRNLNANSIWTSKPTGVNRSNPFGSTLFKLLFRIRDNYQVISETTGLSATYPFTFDWLCSNDGGATYTAKVGCRYNNSAGFVHEIAGTIPASWATSSVFTATVDANGHTRLTGQGFTSKFGVLNSACLAPGPDCFPVKLVNAFVGDYGAELIDSKLNQFSIAAQPSRSIWFCGQVQCNEGDPGAQDAGWINSQN
jgi:hypothetical protein